MATAPGPVLLGRRLAHSLTQAQLARRAGTTQAAISRIERGRVSPTFATFSSLLGALGEVPEVTARRAAGSHDARHLADMAARSPEERLELAMSWNKLAGEIALAGRRARVDRGDVIALTEAEVTGRE
ncbi:MAG: helix-turn-helix domain-containing protein [Solirubrobacteraceae bacterium]